MMVHIYYVKSLDAFFYYNINNNEWSSLAPCAGVITDIFQISTDGIYALYGEWTETLENYRDILRVEQNGIYDTSYIK
jgi:hypothetical protein